MWAASNPLATLAIALSLSNVNFQGHYAPNNMGLYLESTTGTLIGVYFAFLCAALFRRWGTDQVVARLMRQDAQEMLHLNRHVTGATYSAIRPARWIASPRWVAAWPPLGKPIAAHSC